MQRLLLGLCLVWIAALSATRAQGVLAEGTYGLASGASFSNASAFAISPSLLVTEGVLEVDALGVGVLTSLRVQDGLGNEALLTIQFDVGYSFVANVINMAIIECKENVLIGPGFGFSLCAAANSENGCSRSIGWGQGTVDEPFENRTLIIMSNMCSLQGTQLWQCGAVGGCNPVQQDLAEPALPIGNFLLDGIPPVFVYESPQSNLISLQNTTLTAFNNYEYMLMFSFASGPVSIIARIYGAVVVDQSSLLLFSFYNCSQAVSGGPAPVDVCTIMMQAGGCETPVVDSQVDLNPPQNETAIQLTNWCDFFSTIQYKCSGTCQGPINRLVSPTTLGFNVGNCLSYNGATLSFSGSPATCQIPLVAVDQIIVNNLNVTGQLSNCPGTGPLLANKIESCNGGAPEFDKGIISSALTSSGILNLTSAGTFFLNAPSGAFDAPSGFAFNKLSVLELSATQATISELTVTSNITATDGFVNNLYAIQTFTTLGDTYTSSLGDTYRQGTSGTPTSPLLATVNSAGGFGTTLAAQSSRRGVVRVTWTDPLPASENIFVRIPMTYTLSPNAVVKTYGMAGSGASSFLMMNGGLASATDIYVIFTNPYSTSYPANEVAMASYEVEAWGGS